VSYIINAFTGKFDFVDTTSIPPGTVAGLTGNSGGIVGPDGSNNINLLGNNTQGINIAGNAGTNTLTISGINSSETQLGVVELATAVETTTGTSTTQAVHPSGLNTKLGPQTLNALIYGQGGAGTNLASLGAATDGQLPIGSTGNPPVLASLTQPAAGITIAGGPGTITFSLANDLLALENLAGVGFAVRSAADTWVQRTLANAADGSISFTNGNGVSGNPTILLNDRVRMQGPYWENLGFTYTVGTGTFTIHSADGTALSASNPGIIVLPSKTSFGSFLKYNITANQAFIDDNGASEIIGNLFGLTTGVAFAQDVPFYIYAVTNDALNAIAFMISRIPNRTLSPAAANIGMPSTPAADIQSSFFSFDNITAADYESNPSVCIGSFRMRMSNLDDWTVQTLAANDGIGLFQENQSFTLALGSFGAATGTYILANGGTAPVFTTNFLQYSLDRTGKVTLHYFLDGDGGADGAGAVITRMIVPFIQASANGFAIGNGFASYAAGVTNEGTYQFFDTAVNNVRFNIMTSAIANVTNSLFTNGARTLSGNITYFLSIAL
jgi:hypothetical protein